ncbi:adenosine deaminase-like protein isoform X2 [Cephus cinctus]|uniref:Adenosine deaminase-like protein isoform X2 n=1 Tax=Cephus cinctus TaxID=211228 RepID=A0AAJ7BUK8_CEPCN|nr:adenosine deaminase-like protein isoform X2 [Cephus cinctus]
MSSTEKINLDSFCRALPKVELHAHLNGSLSLRIMKKLYELQHSDGRILMDLPNIEEPNSLEECFQLFPIVHSLTSTSEAVFIATCDMIGEFYDDGVIYLEVRSTPRAVDGVMTKKEYVEAIIRGIITSKNRYPEILVKYLISVDRMKGYESAKQNIELAIEMIEQYPDYVVGLDLSGDPSKGSAFLELLEKSRKAGLKITAHCAEVPNEIEIMDILNFKPDRLGHCTCIHPTLNGKEELFQRLIQSNIPIELCLTSNIKCGTVPSYDLHQFKYLYEAGHPICIAPFTPHLAALLA